MFKAYPYKSDPTKIAYYRHVGFERRFRFIGDKWYLEITPTYHFTSDGHQVHPFHEGGLQFAAPAQPQHTVEI